LIIINHLKGHLEYFTEIHLFRYANNNKDDTDCSFNYKETYHYFSHTSPKFLVYPNKLLATYYGALISEWDDQHFLYKNTYYLLYSDADVNFNKDNTMMATYYKNHLKLIVYSLKYNFTISSCKYL